jgi:hypothetical protein
MSYSMAMRQLQLRFVHALLGLSLGGLTAVSCGSDDSSGEASNFGNGGSGNGGSGGTANSAGVDGSAASGGTGAGVNLDGSFSDTLNPDAACDLQKFEATLVKKPVDIIFVVDNSCSMTNEVTAIQTNINVNFANIIAASGVDYRVILIADYGPTGDESLCINPPLSGAPCPAPVQANGVPTDNPPIFFHYDNGNVESTDSWCKMINWYDKPDIHGHAPTGWKDWLRADSFKAFVEITDDRVSCSAGTWSYNDGGDPTTAAATAAQFDTDLLARDPLQFGTAAERNYIWYSIVGVVGNPASADQSYPPTDPIVTTKCTSAVNTGMGHQAVSQLTGGLRFPVCEGNGFDAVFQEIAKGVIEGAKVACEFPIPDPPNGKELDPTTITINYTPGGTGTPQQLEQVPSLAQCKPNAFYLEADLIKLCPDACTSIQSDDKAAIEILALCKGGIAK